MPIIRGVICALASCTVTSSADATRATRVKVEAAMVLKIVRAVSGLTWDCEPTDCSYRVSNETVIRASGMLRAGKTQSELRMYKRM